MWADRLLDGKATGYGLWEASMNGTNAAIDMIPKDIIMCDWHYERKYPLQPTRRSTFPSVEIFVDKGFRVLPTSFRDVKVVRSFIDQSLAVPSDKVLGHLCTLWHPPDAGTAPGCPARGGVRRSGRRRPEAGRGREAVIRRRDQVAPPHSR